MSTLTTQQKSDIDKLWTEFWTGGITNPLTVIEQISFLMFARLLDVMETTGERKAERTKKEFHGRFKGPTDPRRWKNFKQKDAAEMLRVVRDEVFPHFRKLNGGTTFAEYMQDAQLMIQKPSLLVSAVNMIDKLPITDGRRQGRSLRVPALEAHDGGHQRPVPHAPPHHPLHGGALGAQAHRDHRRPGLRHGGLSRGRHAVPARGAHLAAGPAQGRERRGHLHRRPAGAVPRAHPERHVPRLRLRRDHAPHRVDEPDAPRRRQPGHPLPGHAVQQLPREVRQAGRFQEWRRLRRHPRQPAVQGQPRRGRRSPDADAGGEDQEDRAALRGAHSADAQEGRTQRDHRARRCAVRIEQGAHRAARHAGEGEPARSGDLAAERRVQAVRGRVDGHPGVHQGGQDRPCLLLRRRRRRLLARRQARSGQRERPARRTRALAEAEREEGH
jgi:hypothetical protein